MSSSKAAPGFPYDHLGVLGFRKLRKYVPPASTLNRTRDREPSNGSGEDRPQSSAPPRPSTPPQE